MGVAMLGIEARIVVRAPACRSWITIIARTRDEAGGALGGQQVGIVARVEAVVGWIGRGPDEDAERVEGDAGQGHAAR